MPVNRNSLIRYKTIDTCLRNKYRKWTLEDLVHACSEALYEFEGSEKGISKRTIQMDLQVMRSEKLGYNAPIIVYEKKYYQYADPEYSITNIPLTEHDLQKLTEVVDILRQFKGFTHFQELSGMIQKLENKIHVSKTHKRPVIDLEKNENLKGLQFIDPVFQAIVRKKCLMIVYKSFRARSSNSFVFHPALLKEFRNRWFVLGKKKEQGVFMLLALDRIVALEISQNDVIEFNENDIKNYFNHVVGVSVNEGEKPTRILFEVNHSNAQYVITKPIHNSQKIVEKTNRGIIFSIDVQMNFELEKEILGFGEHLKVLSPPNLVIRIKKKMEAALQLYENV